MPLAEYRRKRNFAKTPEPAPEPVRSRKTALSYLIQKHDATRLHYDFRLELDGVLLSWAVTKGPSLNPADKRLAVRTEDHPLAYGGFEGTIPKGQYGGGTVMLWDKGTWEPASDPHAGLAKGHLAFTLHGERLKGGWDLVRMRGQEKRENWLLIKHKDDEASSKEILETVTSVKTGRSMDEIAGRSDLETLVKRYPDVQLATLVADPPEGDQWVHELKFDGYRLLGYVSDGESSLRTRNGNDWTAKFPSVTKALEQLKAETAVIDMEAVTLNAEGKSEFQALQAALGAGGDAKRIVAYAFDLLHLDGDDLTQLPLTQRKEKLKKLLGKSNELRYSEHIVGQGQAMFEKACETGLEGIISKRAEAPYVTGRHRGWLKVKCNQRQEFIILGYSAARSGERALGALYLGYHKAGKLHYAGKVGTGFTMKSARELTERFAKLLVDEPVLTKAAMKEVPAAEWKSIQWVKPKLLGEVSFTEWTQDGRIRHPSFQGLREDKDAADVKREDK